MGKFSLLALLLLASCTPKMGNPASLIADERIVGVRGDPAEAAPGDLVQYSAWLLLLRAAWTHKACRGAYAIYASRLRKIPR